MSRFFGDFMLWDSGKATSSFVRKSGHKKYNQREEIYLKISCGPTGSQVNRYDWCSPAGREKNQVA